MMRTHMYDAYTYMHAHALCVRTYVHLYDAYLHTNVHQCTCAMCTSTYMHAHTLCVHTYVHSYDAYLHTVGELSGVSYVAEFHVQH